MPCSGLEGFYLTVVFIFLLDINECSTGSPCGDPDVTHTSCQNTEGGFACICVAGFTLNDGVCEGKS